MVRPFGGDCLVDCVVEWEETAGQFKLRHYRAATWLDNPIRSKYKSLLIGPRPQEGAKRHCEPGQKTPDHSVARTALPGELGRTDADAR